MAVDYLIDLDLPPTILDGCPLRMLRDLPHQAAEGASEPDAPRTLSDVSPRDGFCVNSLGEPTHHLNHMRSSSMASCCSDSPTLIFGEDPPLALADSPTRAEARDDVGHVEALGGRLGDPTLGSQVVPATP